MFYPALHNRKAISCVQLLPFSFVRRSIIKYCITFYIIVLHFQWK